MDTELIIIPFIISNIFAIIFLLLAYEKTTVARLILAVLFCWASVTNLYFSQTKPEVYLEYADAAADLYAEFIQGWFSVHVSLFVGTIAIAQLCIAAGLCLKGSIANLSAMGAILFFVAISPLGLYAAFPFPIIVCLGCVFILMQKNKKSLIDHFYNYRNTIRRIGSV